MGEVYIRGGDPNKCMYCGYEGKDGHNCPGTLEDRVKNLEKAVEYFANRI